MLGWDKMGMGRFSFRMRVRFISLVKLGKYALLLLLKKLFKIELCLHFLSYFCPKVTFSMLLLSSQRSSFFQVFLRLIPSNPISWIIDTLFWKSCRPIFPMRIYVWLLLLLLLVASVVYRLFNHFCILNERDVWISSHSLHR